MISNFKSLNDEILIPSKNNFFFDEKNEQK